MSSQNTWELIQNGDTKARNDVWEEYQDLVDYVARRLANTLPRHITLEDLTSYGQFGLLDAIEKFDPDKGFKFSTYALTRIRGSILDELRSQDWVPRSVRQRDRKVESAYQDLVQDLGREPSDEEVAAYLDIPVANVVKTKANNVAGQVYNIDQPVVDDRGAITVAETLASTAGDPSEALSGFDSDGAARAIGLLPEREQLTLAMHYGMGMTLAEIGRQFGVTESRVCQIHTKALKSIRQDMIN